MYSQNKEEKVILKYLKGMVGTLLDIGANDGKTFSNSLTLIKLGWKAVLVEPSPEAFEQLKSLHGQNENVQLMEVAVGKQPGISVLFQSGTLLRKNDVALVSSLKESEIRRWRNDGVFFEEKTVRVVDFQGLLNETSKKTFEFITIDIEGLELEILPKIDFDSLGTLIVCVEWNRKNKEHYNQIMRKYKFKIIYTSPENLIYAR